MRNENNILNKEFWHIFIKNINLMNVFKNFNFFNFLKTFLHKPKIYNIIFLILITQLKEKKKGGKKFTGM